MKITIIGTGYVGLVTGACLADLGHEVTCLDIDKSKLISLRSGKIPFYEPGLEQLIKAGLANNRLIFSDSYEESCNKTEIFFVCVGTPPNEDGSSNLSFLEAAILNISENLKKDAIVFIKSTVPVGTNNLMQLLVNKNGLKDIEIRLASNPEFLKEGDAVRDFMRPDRIIIGSEDDTVKKLAEELYKPLNKQRNKIIFMPIKAAELTKYAANSFLATKISFINELSVLAEKLEIDIDDIRKGIGSDPRIGLDFLYAGLGYGGSCFPKDIDSLIDSYKQHDLDNSILQAVREVNNNQVSLFFDKIIKFFSDQDLSEKSFVIWGLSFKPDTDDIREAVSLKLIKLLSSKVKTLFLFDPVAIPNVQKELKQLNNIKFLNNQYENIDLCHGLIICTEWKIFWNPEYKELTKLQDKIIFDGRNILNKNKANEFGLKYEGIGC